MRNTCSAFDIFKIVEMHKKEEYLYMTQHDLFQEKLKIDTEILKWKNSSEIAKKDYNRYMFFYPDPSFMYQACLIDSAILSLVIDYKLTNLERLKNNHIFNKAQDYDSIIELLITGIKEDPKISYRDLIDLGNEQDELEMYLEKIIEDGVVSRRGKKDDKYWKIRR